ncbi:4-nitrophenyl phosphatase [Abditibacterium utsteinense]|uniref:4-nitrophenyl phosphatase n=1 Tax=Abditibacterium utsteinense TaxID=1960156 RepID=A0A2S8SSN6_9BACT|nr:HAD-IIA family hydrolase [Abditibacterium utsteinense]PQV63749.1 4-nitrophenyl phosphatase [Abditibacterium utsteinense]
MNLDLAAVSTFIFDLDGVIWRGDAPVTGAPESLARLRQAGRRCLFASNNSSRIPQFYAEKLSAMGIPAAPEDVVTSSTATALYLSQHFPRGFSAYVVGEEGIVRALESIGARVISDDEISQSAGIQSVDCVVAGIDRAFNFEKLKRAQQFLLAGAQFIATNRDATFPVENGVFPGAGSIVAAIETAAGTAAISMGKPQPGMFLAILESYGLQPAQAAMIGDRLDTDIAGANRAGIGAIFVATGVTSLQTALEAKGEERPDAHFEDLPALCRALKL